MKKNVYSLVLSDAVVAKIDRAAYLCSMSRSGLINQILADYVSYNTPERRAGEVIGVLESFFGAHGAYRLFSQPSGRMLSLSSPLEYKYNPTVKYSLELFCDGGANLGELRVTMRTQSSALLRALNDFFAVWLYAELSSGVSREAITIDEARFSRRFAEGAPDCDAQAVANALSTYVGILDEAMKLYFSSGGDANAVESTATRKLRLFYSEYKEII